MINTATPSYSSFNGHKRIASGSLPVNVSLVKHAMASGLAACAVRQQIEAWPANVRDDVST